MLFSGVRRPTFRMGFRLSGILAVGGVLIAHEATVIAEPSIHEEAPRDAAIAAHIRALSSADPSRMEVALRALGEAGDPAAFLPICDVLERESDPTLRSLGLIALEKLAYTPEMLAAILRDPARSSVARAYAAWLLGRMEAVEAVPILIERLKDPDDHVRERAMEALGRIGDPRAWKPLIIAAHKDPSPTLRKKAEDVVESFAGGGRHGPDPETLHAQLTDPDPIRRRAAAKALSSRGNWWSIAPLIAALSDDDPEVRRLAARALGDLQDRRAVKPLIAVLPRTKGLERHTVITALGVLKDDLAVEPLLPYLLAPDPDTRRFTARALANIGSPKAAPGLIKALEDIIPENRREVARAIGLTHSVEALPALLTLVREDVEDNQIEAVRAIGRLGPSAIPSLISILRDKNPMVALTAVLALKNMGAEDAIPALEQVARRYKDQYVREEALQAVVELKGARARRKGAEEESADGR